MGASGITSLLDICGRALGAQSQSIRVIGNNVANANTVGYSRREVELQPVASGEGKTYGEGVEVVGVVRKVDQFLLEELQRRTNDVTRLEARDELLARIEKLFTVAGDQKTIGTELTAFFNALEDLKVDPASIPLRSNVINAGESLAQTIRSTFNFVADAQREADSRIATSIVTVNALTTQIADLNRQIAASESSEQQNLALRDKRDELLGKLAEKLSFHLVENSDGTVNVSLGNGFGLVTGSTARELDFTPATSFAEDAGGYAQALDGGKLGFIVYNYSSPPSQPSHVDFTESIRNGGGEIAGLLSMRGIQDPSDLTGFATAFNTEGDLVEIASRVEAIARDLLSRFNTAYRGPDEDPGTVNVLDPSARNLNNTAPGLLGLFNLQNSYTIIDQGAPAVLDTVTGAVDPEDVAYVPADTLEGRFASKISFAVTQPRDLAAALDLNAAAGTVEWAPGDAGNIDRLLKLKDESVDFGTYQVGPFTGNMPLETLYTDTVAHVGALKNTTESQVQTARDRQTQMKEFQASVSGVNLDDELANLISFQRAFQASSRLIKTGDELLNEIINLIG